jgi:hypothetical protein
MEAQLEVVKLLRRILAVLERIEKHLKSNPNDVTGGTIRRTG